MRQEPSMCMVIKKSQIMCLDTGADAGLRKEGGGVNVNY